MKTRESKPFLFCRANLLIVLGDRLSVDEFLIPTLSSNSVKQLKSLTVDELDVVPNDCLKSF